MNCNEIKEKLFDLFDEEISSKEKDEILQHLENCPDCRHEFEVLKNMLENIKPAVKVKASKELKNKIINRIKTNHMKEENKHIKIAFPNWAKIAVAAAVIVFAVLISPFIKWNTSSPSGNLSAMNEILDKSIAALANIKSVYMNLNIRTLARDNFELIEADSEFVKNEIWKTFSTPEKWKIEKAGRVVLMDGSNQYLYVKNNLAIKSGKNAGFVEWLKILLDPALIMEAEKKFAKENNADYNIQENGNKIILTIKAKALGDFKNNYALNSSILESNNTRIYTFDKQNNLLLSLQIYIEKAGKNILVVDSKEIKYNLEIPENIFSIQLPDGMVWSDSKETEISGSLSLKNASPEEVAKVFFEGLSNSDWNKVKTVFPDNLNDDLKNYFGGLKIISIGKAFKSGLYKGYFVPYEVKLKSGEIKKNNLTVRNDNKEKSWQVDGGF